MMPMMTSPTTSIGPTSREPHTQICPTWTPPNPWEPQPWLSEPAIPELPPLIDPEIFPRWEPDPWIDLDPFVFMNEY
jgi:hypothetical protein